MNLEQFKIGLKLLKFSILLVILVFLLKWYSKHRIAIQNKENISKLNIGMNKKDVERIMGKPYIIYDNKYHYKINASLICPMIAVVETQNDHVDTIYLMLND